MSERAPETGSAAQAKLPADLGLKAPLAVVLAVILPGAGHFLLGQRGKAILLGGVMLAAMWAGLDLGRWANFTPEAFDRHPVMYSLQFLAGVPAVVGYLFRTTNSAIEAFANPKLFEIALLYTCVVGLLNLLLIIDVIALPGRMVAKIKAERERAKAATETAKIAAPPIENVPAAADANPPADAAPVAPSDSDPNSGASGGANDAKG